MGRACKCCGEEVCRNRRVKFNRDKYKPSYKRFVKSVSFEETESRKVIVVYNLDENGNRTGEASREDQGWQLQDRRKGQTSFYEDNKKEIVNAPEEETSEPVLGPQEVRSVINGSQETVTTTQERVLVRNDIETRNVLKFNIDNMFDYEITDSQGEDLYIWTKLVLMLSEPLEGYVNDSACKINVHGVYHDEDEPFTWRQAGQMIDRAENSKSITYKLDSDEGSQAPVRSESAWIDITDWDVLKGDGSYMFLISVDEGSTEIGNFGSEDNSKYGYSYYSTRSHQFLRDQKTIREAFLQFEKRFPEIAANNDANYDDENEFLYGYNLYYKNRLVDWGNDWSDDFIRVARDSNGEDVYESKKSFLPGDNFNVDSPAPYDLLNYLGNKLVFQLFTPKKDNTKKGREKLYLDYFVAMRDDHQQAADEIAEVCPDAQFYDENFFFKSWRDTKDDNGGILGQANLEAAARIVEGAHGIAGRDGSLVLDGLDVYPYVKPRRLYRYDKKIGVNGKTFYVSPSCFQRGFSSNEFLAFNDFNHLHDKDLFYLESLAGWSEENITPFVRARFYAPWLSIFEGFYTSSRFEGEKFPSEYDIYRYNNPLWSGAVTPTFTHVNHRIEFSVKNSKIDVDLNDFCTELETYQSFNGARDLDVYGEYTFIPKEYDSSDVRLRIKIDPRFYLTNLRVEDIKAVDINEECRTLCDSDFYDPFPFFEISLDAPYSFSEGIRTYNYNGECSSQLICSRDNGKTTPSKIHHAVDKSAVKYKQELYAEAFGAYLPKKFCAKARKFRNDDFFSECIDFTFTSDFQRDTAKWEETRGEFINNFGSDDEGIVKVDWDYESSLDLQSPIYCYPEVEDWVKGASKGTVDGTGQLAVIGDYLGCNPSRSVAPGPPRFPVNPEYPKDEFGRYTFAPDNAVSSSIYPIAIANFDYYENFYAITTEIIVDTHSNDIPVSATTLVDFSRYGDPKTIITDDINGDLAWSDIEDRINSEYYSLSNLRTLKVHYKNDIFDTQESVLSYSVNPSDDEPWWKYINSDYWDEGVDVDLLGVFRDDVPDLKFDGQLIEIKRKKVFTEDEIEQIQNTGLGENPDREAFIIYEVTEEEPDEEGNIRNGFYKIDHLNHEGPLKDKDDKILEESPLVIYKTPALFKVECEIEYFGAVPSVSEHQKRNDLWEPQDPYEIQPKEHEVEDSPKGYHAFHEGFARYTTEQFPRAEYDYSVEKEYLESEYGLLYSPSINNFYNPIDGILPWESPSSSSSGFYSAVEPIDFTNNLHNIQNFIAKTESNTVSVDAPDTYANELQFSGTGKFLAAGAPVSDSPIDVQTGSISTSSGRGSDIFTVEWYGAKAITSGDVEVSRRSPVHVKANIVRNYESSFSYILPTTDIVGNPFGYYPNLTLDSVDVGIHRSYSQVENLTQYDLYSFQSRSIMTAYKLFYEEDVIEEDFEIEIDGTDFSVFNGAPDSSGLGQTISTGTEIDSAYEKTVAYYLYTIAWNLLLPSYPNDLIREILLESFPEIQDFIDSETYDDAGIYATREKKYKRKLLFISNIYQEQGSDPDDIYANIQLDTDLSIRDGISDDFTYQSLGSLIQRTAVKNNTQKTTQFIYDGNGGINRKNPRPAIGIDPFYNPQSSNEFYSWPAALNFGVKEIVVDPFPCLQPFSPDYTSCGLFNNPAIVQNYVDVLNSRFDPFFEFDTPNVFATTYGPIGYSSDFVAKTRGVSPSYSVSDFYVSSTHGFSVNLDRYESKLSYQSASTNYTRPSNKGVWILNGSGLDYLKMDTNGIFLGGFPYGGQGPSYRSSDLLINNSHIDLYTATKASWPEAKPGYRSIYLDYVESKIYDAVYKRIDEAVSLGIYDVGTMITSWLASYFRYEHKINRKVNYSSETIKLDEIKVKVKTVPRPTSEDGKII